MDSTSYDYNTSLKEVSPEGMNLLPWGANSFLKEKPLILKGFVAQGSYGKLQKLLPLVKVAEKLGSFIHLP